MNGCIFQNCTEKNEENKNKVCFWYISAFRDFFLLYLLVMYSSVISAFSPLLDLNYARYLWQVCIFQYDSEMSGLFKKKAKCSIWSEFVYVHSLVLNM